VQVHAGVLTVCAALHRFELMPGLLFDLPLEPGQISFMPRKLRIQYPGAMYHVMNRGDPREDMLKTSGSAAFMDLLEMNREA